MGKKERMAYLNACLGDGDEEGLDAFFLAILDVARAKGVAALAEQANMARDTYYKALERKNPTVSTFRDILHSLGYEMAVVQRKSE